MVNNFTRQWGKILRRANVRELEFHDLRSTALSNWFANGMSEHDVMTLAEHSSFATSHQFYLAVADDLVVRWAFVMNIPAITHRMTTSVQYVVGTRRRKEFHCGLHGSIVFCGLKVYLDTMPRSPLDYYLTIAFCRSSRHARASKLSRAICKGYQMKRRSYHDYGDHYTRTQHGVVHQ